MLAASVFHSGQLTVDEVKESLRDEGIVVRDIVGTLFARHADGLDASGILDDPPLEQVNRQWRRIERFWTEQIRYIY